MQQETKRGKSGIIKLKNWIGIIALASILTSCGESNLAPTASLEPATTQVEEPGPSPMILGEEPLEPGDIGDIVHVETAGTPDHYEMDSVGPTVPGAGEESVYGINREAAASNRVRLRLLDRETGSALDHGQSIQLFIHAVEEISGGSIQIETVDADTYPDNVSALDRMTDQEETLDLCVVSPLDLAIFGDDKSPLLSMPFLFRSEEQFSTFAQSDLGRAFLDSPGVRGIGVQSLFYINEGFRHFASSEPYEIRNLSDLYQLRMAGGAETNMLYRSLVGQAGAFMEWVEARDLYNAFSVQFDVAPVTLQEYENFGLEDKAPNLSLDRHSLSLFELVISDDSWTMKLSPSQRNVLQQAAKLAMQENLQSVKPAEEELLSKFQSLGVNIIKTQPNEEWQKDVAVIIKNNVPPQLMPYYNEINALQ